eukprot:6001041-Alexandrium_andersonii.AAC.1
MPRRLQHHGPPPALAADPRCSFWGGAAGLWEPSKAQLAEYAGSAATARGRVRSARGATPAERPALPA